MGLFQERRNIHQNDTQHNDIQHNDIQHNETQHNDSKRRFFVSPGITSIS
jgi:hypothetical protein